MHCESVRLIANISESVAGAVSSYERIPFIKIPVHEEPNEVVDEEKNKAASTGPSHIGSGSTPSQAEASACPMITTS